MTTSYAWRTRRREFVSGRSKHWFFAGLAANAAILPFLWFHAQGTTVTVESDPSESFVTVGRESKPTTGPAVFEHVPYGEHPIRVERQYYRPFSETAEVGWFGGHKVQARLEPLPVDLVVHALPGAEVSIDGRLVGRAGTDGTFRKRDGVLGRHQIAVRLAGYKDWNETVELVPPRASIYAQLTMTPEKVQALRQQRERIDTLIYQAEQMYNARQYREAIAALDIVLQLEPDHARARQFRERVRQTMDILNNR